MALTHAGVLPSTVIKVKPQNHQKQNWLGLACFPHSFSAPPTRGWKQHPPTSSMIGSALNILQVG